MSGACGMLLADAYEFALNPLLRLSQLCLLPFCDPLLHPHGFPGSSSSSQRAVSSAYHSACLRPCGRGSHCQGKAMLQLQPLTTVLATAQDKNRLNMQTIFPMPLRTLLAAGLLVRSFAETSDCPHEDSSLLQSRSTQSIGDEKAGLS